MTVLVACNDSAHGAAALAAGIAEAKRRQLALRLLVLDPGTEVPERLRPALAELDPAPEVFFRPTTLEASDAILNVCNDLDTSLVVIGARKHSADNTHMGTTTQRVLLDALAPVLVVKASYS